jgi:hypothetical protein
MGNGVAEPPPPVEQETMSTVQEPTEGDTQEATGSLTQTVLDLIAGVFSLV